jgi:hypothetical protein
MPLNLELFELLLLLLLCTPTPNRLERRYDIARKQLYGTVEVARPGVMHMQETRELCRLKNRRSMMK